MRLEKRQIKTDQTCIFGFSLFTGFVDIDKCKIFRMSLFKRAQQREGGRRTSQSKRKSTDRIINCAKHH